MRAARTKEAAAAKQSSGIEGFDTIAHGGLPLNRITVISGEAGSGKTIFAIQTAVHVVRGGGRAVFVSFEEEPEAIHNGARRIAGAPGKLPREALRVIDARPDPDAVHAGSFDILALLSMVRAELAQDGPALVVFDGIDALLEWLTPAARQRVELLRLHRWADGTDATVLLTVKAPSPAAASPFNELAMYTADCVVELRRAAEDTVSTRSLRIRKYRGSGHLQSWVPYTIGTQGLELMTMPGGGADAPVSAERLSTGIKRLDEMLRGGVYRGSATLLSGSPGTSKTTLAAKFLETQCVDGEKALVVSFDEQPQELVRNMASVGIHLDRHLRNGLLQIRAFVTRASSVHELIHEIDASIREHGPRHLLVDPVSTFAAVACREDAYRAALQVVQRCKRQGITVWMTSVLEDASGGEASKAHVSTLCDNWIHLSNLVQGGERNRALTIAKSRGTGHSNQVAELLLSEQGVKLADVYAEEGEVLMGSLRWQKEQASAKARELADVEARQRRDDEAGAIAGLVERIDQLQRELDRRKQTLEQIEQNEAGAAEADSNRRREMRRLRTGLAKGNTAVDDRR